MSASDDSLCRDCGKPLPSGLFAKGETRVMGGGYCPACVQARTLYCHGCRSSLKAEDFARGKAVTLLGRRYCENCLESAVQKGREKAVADPPAPVQVDRPRLHPPTQAASPAGAESDEGLDEESIAIRRLYGRYIPHAEASLVLKAGGLGSLLGNRVRLWLDASEGGFRAIVNGRYELEAVFTGALVFRPTRDRYPFKAVVMHVRNSQRYPGCCIVGCRFNSPSSELEGFIRGKMSRQPAMIPSPRSKHAARAPGSSTTSVPPPSPARA